MRITVLKFRPCTSQAPRIALLTLYLASSSTGFITLYHRQTNILHPSQSSTGNTSSESKAVFHPRPRRLHATNLQRPSTPVPRLLFPAGPFSVPRLRTDADAFRHRVSEQNSTAIYTRVSLCHTRPSYCPRLSQPTRRHTATSSDCPRNKQITRDHSKAKASHHHRTARRHEAIHLPQLSPRIFSCSGVVSLSSCTQKISVPISTLLLLMFNFVPRPMVPSLSPSGLKLQRRISFADRTLSSLDTAKVTSALSAAFRR